MKRIGAEQLPSVLTEEVISILAEMADEVPQSKEWHEIFDLLSPDDLRKVMDRKIELQRKKERERKEAMTKEQRDLEEQKWQKIKEDKDPFKFYGNMGQPETPQEYKNRYGVWPPGYDESGNKK